MGTGTCTRMAIAAVVVAVALSSTTAVGRAKSTEQQDFEDTTPTGAALFGGISAIVTGGNVYAITKGKRQLGWAIPGFITASFCAEFGLLSFMYGEIGARYGLGFLAMSAVLTTVSWWNLRLPRPPDPPRELAEPEAMLVPTVLPGASTMVPGLALTATW